MTIDTTMSIPETQGDGIRKIMLDILNQLREEMDLSRVSLPAFLLEPISMLERITHFSAHLELLLRHNFKIIATDVECPISRFVEVVRYFASGWHIQPKGAKKPYNPVLGEIFRCRYAFKDGSKGYYLAEQVSHHPPISAYFFANPQKGITIQGDLRPKGKFLGNSAATLLQGSTDIIMLSRDDETYRITFPNVYAKGVLVGNLRMEVGDRSSIKCEKSNLVCHLDFKTTGMFCNDMNQLRGEIKELSTGNVLYEITGSWMNKLYITDKKTNQKSLFLDADMLQIQSLIVEDDDKQQYNESRQVWKALTMALNANNMEAANREKHAVEEHQRNQVKLRQEENITWTPHYFNLINNIYSLKGMSSLNMDNASEAEVQLDNLFYQEAEQYGLSE